MLTFAALVAQALAAQNRSASPFASPEPPRWPLPCPYCARPVLKLTGKPAVDLLTHMTGGLCQSPTTETDADDSDLLNPPCRVYWGSHSCTLPRGHAGDCRCWCVCADHARDGAAQGCACAAPFYGPDTRFFGEDAAARGLPLAPQGSPSATATVEAVERELSTDEDAAETSTSAASQEDSATATNWAIVDEVHVHRRTADGLRPLDPREADLRRVVGRYRDDATVRPRSLAGLILWAVEEIDRLREAAR